MSAVQEKYRCERPIQHRSLSSKQLWCSVPEGKEFASCQKCIRSKLRKPKKASSIFFLLLFDHLAQQISENAPPRMVNLPASVLFPYTMMCVSTYIRKKGKDKKSKDVRLHLNFHEINVQIRLLFVGILEHSLMFGMLFFVAQWILRINIRGVRLDGEKKWAECAVRGYCIKRDIYRPYWIFCKQISRRGHITSFNWQNIHSHAAENLIGLEKY